MERGRGGEVGGIERGGEVGGTQREREREVCKGILWPVGRLRQHRLDKQNETLKRKRKTRSKLTGTI